MATSPRYLFPVRALSRRFRGKYLAGLGSLHATGKLEFHGQLQGLAGPEPFAALRRSAAQREWVVYAKRPFAGPEQVLAYLSRYTHRVAISPEGCWPRRQRPSPSPTGITRMVPARRR